MISILARTAPISDQTGVGRGGSFYITLEPIYGYDNIGTVTVRQDATCDLSMLAATTEYVQFPQIIPPLFRPTTVTHVGTTEMLDTGLRQPLEIQVTPDGSILLRHGFVEHNLNKNPFQLGGSFSFLIGPLNI